MRNRYLYITLLSILGFNAETYVQAIAQAPRLVVSISIDQLRTDYLENYAPAYTNDGLNRLLNEGCVYTHASYPFAPIDRASAIAALHTGAVPYYNGITGTEWMNRQTLRPESILSDKTYQQSPEQLATSTLGDELKIATLGQAHVYAIATDAVCAILSAGHAANGALWINHGYWATTDYYQPVSQWISTFRRNYAPQADANMSIVQAALNCLEQNSMGMDEKTDLLCLSLQSGTDISQYLTLDHALSFLINGITQRLPLQQVLFVITGNSSTEDEEKKADYSRYRIPTGKFYMDRTANLLNMYLGAVYGSASYIETSYKNQLFVNRQLLEKKNINMGDLLRRSQEFILQLAGVRNVYTVNQLITSDSQQLKHIRNGFNVERCGDLLIEIQPGWELANEQTHTSSVSRLANIPFPIIFFGASVKAQRVETLVTADRIAPTVARCIRIRAPNACEAEPLF